MIFFNHKELRYWLRFALLILMILAISFVQAQDFSITASSLQVCPALKQVSWTNTVNTVVNSDGIQGKIGGWWSGGQSLEQITGNGYIEYTIESGAVERMIGLSNVNTDPQFGSIKYAFYLQSGGGLLVFENGGNMGQVGSYAAGKKIRITVFNNIVYYYYDNTLVYKSNSRVLNPLVVDVSFATQGATFNKVQMQQSNIGNPITFTENQPAEGSYKWYINDILAIESIENSFNAAALPRDIIYCIKTVNGVSSRSNTFTVSSTPLSAGVPVSITASDLSVCPAIKQVSWTNTVNTVVNSNGIQGKIGGWWSGGQSLEQITGNGYIEYTIESGAYERMIGLSNVNTDPQYGSIKNAFYLQSGGGLLVFENGGNMGQVGTYAADKKIRIAVDKGIVYYYYDGALVYNSNSGASFPLVVDVSFATQGAIFNKVMMQQSNTGSAISFTGSPAAGGTYQWYVNNKSEGDASHILSQSALIPGDVVKATFHPTDQCAASSKSDSLIVTSKPLSAGVPVSITASDLSVCPAIKQVSWTNTVNTIVNSDGIQGKIGGWWSGGQSLEQITGNGYIEYTIESGAYERMIGLSNVNTDPQYGSIKNAFYLQSGGGLLVFENGGNMGQVGTYAAGKKIRIAVDKGIVYYYYDGALVYNSNSGASFPLVVDVSFATQGAIFNKVMMQQSNTGSAISFTGSPAAGGTYQWYVNNKSEGDASHILSQSALIPGDVVKATFHPTDQCAASSKSDSLIVTSKPISAGVPVSITASDLSVCPAIKQVSWTNTVNTVVNSNGIEGKIGGWWSGGQSLEQITGNGYIEYTIEPGAYERMIGLSNVNTDPQYGSIKNAFYLQSGGGLLVFENGGNMGQVGTYAAGKKIRIAVDKGIVYYYYDGALVYNSNSGASFPLVVDVSFATQGAIFNKVMMQQSNTGSAISFTGSPAAGGTYQWYVNNKSEGDASHILSQSALIPGDVVKATFHPTDQCAASSKSDSLIVTSKPLSAGVPVSITASDLSVCPAIKQVSWTNTVNTIVNSDGIQGKIGGWWSGGQSLEQITGNGYIEYTIESGAYERMIGLSNVNTDPQYGSIKNAFYLQSGGGLLVFENGGNMGQVGTYAAGKKIRIAVDKGIVYYYYDGALVYNSNSGASFPLVVDVSFATQGAIFNKVMMQQSNTGSAISFTGSPAAGGTYQWYVNNKSEGDASHILSQSALIPGDVVKATFHPTDQCAASSKSDSLIVTSKPISAGVPVSITASDLSVCPAIKQVSWTNTVNTVVNSNGIQGKIGGWWSGGQSLEQITGNGYIEYTIESGAYERMIGLSNVNTDPQYGSIKNAFYLQSGGGLLVFENGGNMGQVGTYAAGKKIRIAVDKGIVYYYYDGALVYNSNSGASFPLVVDVSFATQGAIFNKVMMQQSNTGSAISFTGSPASGGTYQWYVNNKSEGDASHILSQSALIPGDVVKATFHPTDQCAASSKSDSLIVTSKPLSAGVPVSITASDLSVCPAIKQVSWTNTVNTVVNSNGIEGKIGGWWSGGQSLEQITGNGYIEYTIESGAYERMIGLSNVNTDPQYGSIKNAFYLQSGGGLLVFENGGNMGQVGTYVAGKKIRIAVDKGIVYYYYDGALVYNSNSGASFPLVVDVSFATQGAIFNKVMMQQSNTGSAISFTGSPAAGGTYQWYVNNKSEGDGGHILSQSALIPGDVVKATFHPTDQCAPSSKSDSLIVVSCLYSLFTVTNTGDSGPGSLRVAIDSANAHPDYSKIIFNIPGPGPYVLSSSGDLTLTNPVFIDGTSQPGYNQNTKYPIVQVSNVYNGNWTNFYLIGNSKGSEIKGLYLQNAGYYGIWIKVDSVTIRDNVINQIRFRGIYALTCIGFNNAGSYSTVVGNTFHSDSTGADKSLFLSDSIPVGIYIYSTGTPIHDIKIGGFGESEGNRFSYEEDGLTIDGLNITNISVLGNTFKTILESNIFVRASSGTTTNTKPVITKNANNTISGSSGIADLIQVYLSNESGIDAVRYLGKTTAVNGAWSFDLTTSLGGVPTSGSPIIATATNEAGSTSQFSSASVTGGSKLFIDTRGANPVPFTISGTGLPSGISFVSGLSGPAGDGLIPLNPSTPANGQSNTIVLTFSSTLLSQGISVSFALNSNLKISDVKVADSTATSFVDLGETFYSIDSTCCLGQVFKLLNGMNNEPTASSYSTNLKDGLIYQYPANRSFQVFLTGSGLSFLKLSIYDFNDLLIKELSQPVWDGKNGQNQLVNDGIYKYKIEAVASGTNNKVFQGQMILKR